MSNASVAEGESDSGESWQEVARGYKHSLAEDPSQFICR